MTALTSSQKAVISYIDGSWIRYSAISTLENANIVVDNNKLTSSEILSTLWQLRLKGIIEYTWVQDELLYVLHSKLPQ